MIGMTVCMPVRADAAEPHTVVVDDDLACAGAAFSTIQAGIDAAQPGDFVAICAGVYPEQLTITKNLTLTPYSGDARPVVRAPAAPHESRCGPPGSGVTAIVDVCGNGVVANLLDVTVAGPGPGACGSLNSGVLITGGSQVFAFGLQVLDIRDEPLSACDSGVAIQAGKAAWASTGTFATSGGLITTGYQQAGVVAEGVGSWALLSGSPTITGLGTAARQPQTGVRIAHGAMGTFDGTISGTITANTCRPTTCGGGSGAGVEIVDSVLNSAFGAHNVVTNANINGNDIAIAVTSQTSVSNPADVLVGQNNIHDNGTALLVSDEQPTDATVPAVSGQHNVIAGNTYGVRNTSSAVLNFARNWWGDASGPSGWSTGTGDAVSSNVRFFPWTTDAGFSATAACTITGTNAPEVLNGTSGNDIMCGKGGNDTLNGLGGNDLIMGDGGNDILVGGPGNDAILGTSGNDILKGGAGLDSLQGGEGTDTCSDPNPFQFATCETGP